MSSGRTAAMAMPVESRLYLFARLPDDVGAHLDVSNDVQPVLPGLNLVSAARRHITVADLSGIDAPQDYVDRARPLDHGDQPAARLPCRVRRDRRERAQHIAQGEPAARRRARMPGACARHAAPLWLGAGPATLRRCRMSRSAMARAMREGVRPIDGISWLVDELVLVRSWRGRNWHEELGRWHLPMRRQAAA